MGEKASRSISWATYRWNRRWDREEGGEERSVRQTPPPRNSTPLFCFVSAEANDGDSLPPGSGWGTGGQYPSRIRKRNRGNTNKGLPPKAPTKGTTHGRWEPRESRGSQ